MSCVGMRMVRIDHRLIGPLALHTICLAKRESGFSSLSGTFPRQPVLKAYSESTLSWG